MHSTQDVNNLLDVRGLHIKTATQTLVQDLNFQLARGQTLAIVGESGSGKSISSLALLGLLPSTLSISGQALFQGQDLLRLNATQLRAIRGKKNCHDLPRADDRA